MLYNIISIPITYCGGIGHVRVILAGEYCCSSKFIWHSIRCFGALVLRVN